MNNLLKFLYAFCTVAVTAIICGYFSQYGIAVFYDNLIMPAFTPINQVFPFMWSILYSLMIISFYSVIKNRNYNQTRQAVLLFSGQLLLQIIWCYFFFYTAYFLFAGITILLLIWTVAEMIKWFKSITPFAAYLQYPYFLWLIFAAYLNFGVVYLNGNMLNS